MIPKDKLLHFIAGAAIVYLCSVFLSLSISLLICVIIGFAKEYIYDIRYPNKHTVDLYDALVTVLGGVVVFVLLI